MIAINDKKDEHYAYNSNALVYFKECVVVRYIVMY